MRKKLAGCPVVCIVFEGLRQSRSSGFGPERRSRAEKRVREVLHAWQEPALSSSNRAAMLPTSAASSVRVSASAHTPDLGWPPRRPDSAERRSKRWRWRFEDRSGCRFLDFRPIRQTLNGELSSSFATASALYVESMTPAYHYSRVT